MEQFDRDETASSKLGDDIADDSSAARPASRKLDELVAQVGELASRTTLGILDATLAATAREGGAMSAAAEARRLADRTMAAIEEIARQPSLQGLGAALARLDVGIAPAAILSEIEPSSR
jgi:hypothetical protein